MIERVLGIQLSLRSCQPNWCDWVACFGIIAEQIIRIPGLKTIAIHCNLQIIGFKETGSCHGLQRSFRLEIAWRDQQADPWLLEINSQNMNHHRSRALAHQALVVNALKKTFRNRGRLWMDKPPRQKADWQEKANQQQYKQDS